MDWTLAKYSCIHGILLFHLDLKINPLKSLIFFNKWILKECEWFPFIEINISKVFFPISRRIILNEIIKILSLIHVFRFVPR